MVASALQALKLEVNRPTLATKNLRRLDLRRVPHGRVPHGRNARDLAVNARTVPPARVQVTPLHRQSRHHHPMTQQAIRQDVTNENGRKSEGVASHRGGRKIVVNQRKSPRRSTRSPKTRNGRKNALRNTVIRLLSE